MREFVVVGHDAPTTPDFSLSDLPGVGRLDLLSRCVTAALLTSHGIREDVTVRLVLADAVTLRFEGDTIRNLHPDERSTAALVRSALEERAEAIGHVPVETSPGVSLTRRGLADTLSAVAEEGTVVSLHESGTPASRVAPPEDPVFVCSDHRDLAPEERSLVDETAEATVSLGPVPLHADHAVAVAHNWVDTDGYATYDP